MAENLLIVFIKYPEPEHVKSRLALTLGSCEAAHVYKAVTEQLISAVLPSSKGACYDSTVAYSPAGAAAKMRTWLGNDIQLMPQTGSHLGERIHNAFTGGFAQGYNSIAVIGSDCPAVTQELIIEALGKLKNHDVVIGPAADGGYYLIGLRISQQKLFTAIDWSTELVLKQTIERCKALHLNYVLLTELRDIDRIEDLAYYREQGMLF